MIQRGLLFVASAAVASRGIAFACSVLLSSRSGPSVVGEYGYALAVVALSSTVGAFGASPVLTREFATGGDRKVDRGLLFALVIVASALALIMSLICSLQERSAASLDESLSPIVNAYVVFAAAFAAASSLACAALIGIGRIAVAATVSITGIVAQIVVIGCGILFDELHVHLLAIAAGEGVAALISCAVVWRLLQPSREPLLNRLNQFFKRNWRDLAATLVATGVGAATPWLINAFLLEASGRAQLGLLVVATQVRGMLLFLPNAISQVMIRIYVNLGEEGGSQGASNNQAIKIEVTAVIAIAGAVTLLGLSLPVWCSIFGEFACSGQLAVILSMAAAIPMVMTSFSWQKAMALRNRRALYWNVASGAGLGIPLAWLLASRGAVGASMAYLVAASVQTLVAHLAARR